MSKLQDRVAIVTGAGSGIGRGIALAYAKEGARVVAVGRRLEKVEETANLIAEEGGRAMAMSVDVSKADAVTRMVEECTKAFGRVDVLVNNAGVIVPGGLFKVNEEQWDWLMSINLKAVYLCCRAVAPIMLERRWGRIINISSMAAILPTVHVAYCVSKGAVITLTKALALELAPGGVTVNAIAPGTTLTEMGRGILKDPVAYADKMSRARVGRLGEPADIAAGALYLASEESWYVTGVILPIDGGWHLT